MLKHFVIIVPELMLITMIMIAQLCAVLYAAKHRTIVDSMIVVLVAIVIYILQLPVIDYYGFSKSFCINSFTKIFKAIVLGYTIINITIYRDLCEITGKNIRIEFIILNLLSTIGILVSISARDFLLLFCGLELQALSAYAMAAFNTSSYKSSEAGLKYFILGALLSCITLFGMSFIYGFSGSLEYGVTLKLLNLKEQNIGLVIGVVLLVSGILFKLSAAPLHMWTPDVYEGSPLVSVIHFSTTQKIGALAILITIFTHVVGNYQQIAIGLPKIIAILSMIIGVFGAITQNSLKRLMAYSTILNTGYVFIGLALHNQAGQDAACIYMIIYTVGIIGFFSCLIALLGVKADDATFKDIEGIASSRKTIAAVISLIMFSMIGIPPLAGFFGKYYLLYQAVVQREFVLAAIGILSSVISAYYYLKIIKSMYFIQGEASLINRIPTQRGLMIITLASTSFIILFSFFTTF
ncbi:MAG: NADH-quinone oxidoreductase subunit N [Rickettsiaceae bacterium]|nr:MAG: NADH-quinone oxidoreductase subunit N [Rickettsiaceae bacterium]